MANGYHFLENMCKSNDLGFIPLNGYMLDLPDNHQAKNMVAISEIAPSKMRGRFYTSALTTLYLFTTPDIHNMTLFTDFDIYNIARKKTAIFIILPDYKSTYYNIATLFVSQLYQIMRDEGMKTGGRLPVRMSYIMDEFGSFAKIPDFTKHMTVECGCGIRYMIFVQAFEQLIK